MGPVAMYASGWVALGMYVGLTTSACPSAVTRAPCTSAGAKSPSSPSTTG
jgi:hypothetical protein